MKIVEAHSDEDTIKRIDRYIQQPPEQSRVITITPTIAEYLLNRYNAGNRPKKPVNIAKYADHMAGNTWALTGDTLKFSDAHLLRDGQNRLMACVRSGASFVTHVVFGVADDAFASMDQGKNRGGSDLLAIAGYSNTNQLAAAVRWAYLIEEGRAKGRDSLAPDMTLRLVTERFPNLPNFINQASAIYRVASQPIGLVAAMLYHFHRADPERASEFAAAWASGAVGGKFSSLGKMQTAIGKIMGKSSGRIHDVVRAALIVRSWNAFVEGRHGNASDFDWVPSDEFPTIKS